MSTETITHVLPFGHTLTLKSTNINVKVFFGRYDECRIWSDPSFDEDRRSTPMLEFRFAKETLSNDRIMFEYHTPLLKRKYKHIFKTPVKDIEEILIGSDPKCDIIDKDLPPIWYKIIPKGDTVVFSA